jgi:hypothetical protein
LVQIFSSALCFETSCFKRRDKKAFGLKCSKRFWSLVRILQYWVLSNNGFLVSLFVTAAICPQRTLNIGVPCWMVSLLVKEHGVRLLKLFPI